MGIVYKSLYIKAYLFRPLAYILNSLLTLLEYYGTSIVRINIGGWVFGLS